MAKKLRVTILSPHRESEIFSMQEAKDGSLGIFVKRPAQISGQSIADYVDLKEMRFSIHPTEGQIWTTLKAHLRTDDDHYRKVYSRICPLDEQLIWPLFGTACADLSREHYALRRRASDEIVSLGAYHPIYGVLTYFLVVTSRGIVLPPMLGMKPLNFEFSRFSLTLYHCYMTCCSLRQGVFAIPGTHIDKEIEGQTWTLKGTPNISCSFDTQNLASCIETLRTMFSLQHLFHLQRQIEIEGDVMPETALNMVNNYILSPQYPT